VNGEVGVDATMPTRWPRARRARASDVVSVLFPAPGGPGDADAPGAAERGVQLGEQPVEARPVVLDHAHGPRDRGRAAGAQVGDEPRDRVGGGGQRGGGGCGHGGGGSGGSAGRGDGRAS
jgi:hypothetical protein